MTFGLLVLTAVAGGVGSGLRYTVDTLVTGWRLKSSPSGMPMGTMVVNLSACLLLGLLTGWAATAAAPTVGAGSAGADVAAAVTVLGVGLLGGYSTFSTACVETGRLLLQGKVRLAVTHGLGMVVGCLIAGMIGIAVGGMLG
ncbi:fluoride efflux transporter FluC [Pseudoclavibacter sp. 13-3]|uniref:fluoride efflux transporter FluC n=1 Tax=Pseudoclavibacter sp. 13-3 TaxID=2901228 RepID=UPI001E3E6B70|nr:CrcB family protein [Pseudoclavibacter sp. 13-3]MCD7102156.1 CrcB family protein [Pseudoclavibacter sp. 13-3]